MTATDADLIRVFWEAAVDEPDLAPYIDDHRGDGTDVMIDTSVSGGINLARALREVIAHATPPVIHTPVPRRQPVGVQHRLGYRAVAE